MRSAFSALRRSLSDPGLLRLRSAAVTYVTALVSGLLASIPASVFGVGTSIVVLAVMLSISFTAERAGTTTGQRWLSVVLLSIIGVAAASVGLLMFSVPLVGDPLFVLVLSAAIWVRRYGAVATRIGTLIALPFVTVLVVPVPVQPGHGFVPWAAATAFAVALVALGVQWAAQASGFVTGGAQRVTAPSGDRATTEAVPARRRSGLRPIASTRMALQMAVTLAGAFLIGHIAFGEHWFWAVLTAYLVASGNRGRGDVLYKGLHRTVGAAGGTIVAFLLALLSPAASAGTGEGAWMAVGAIAIILALGLWLRPAGYAWWAAAMTAMVSLLHSLAGTAPGPVLLIRLGAIVLAGALAVVVAWWVLPVRTGDALRARTSAALAALTDLLVACIRDPDAVQQHRATADDALLRLRQLGPTLRLERAARVRGRGTDHRADVIPAVEACWAAADAIAENVEHGHPLAVPDARQLGALARRLGECRRMLTGAPAPATREPSAAFPELDAAIGGLVVPLSLAARPAA